MNFLTNPIYNVDKVLRKLENGSINSATPMT